jgi:Pyruvate/2-oxoacid:ferredoxin oxidoreductase delta subunit
MIVVDEERCVGCGHCVPFCPEDVLSTFGISKVDGENCTDCLICMDYCPCDAILEEGEIRR